MFFAALAQVHTSQEPHAADGFVIITSGSDQGMVEIHDRKPLVLTSAHAREWLDPDLASERAEAIAKECCQPTDDFELYAVGKKVGNVKNQGAELILPRPPDDD